MLFCQVFVFKPQRSGGSLDWDISDTCISKLKACVPVKVSGDVASVFVFLSLTNAPIFLL